MDFSRKIGPFPLGVWVAVIAGALGLAYVFNRQTASGGGGDGGGTIVEPGVGGTPGGFIPAPQPGDEEPPEEPGILDNEMWAFEATAFLVTQGYEPIAVGIAVRRYLDGETVSPAQAALIKVAVEELGPPPNVPVGGGIVQPKPPQPEPEPEPEPDPPSFIPRKPSTPTGLRASSVSSSRISLRWNAASRAVLYEINRMGWIPRGSTTFKPSSNTKTTSTTGWQWTASAGYTYRFRVRAKNSVGYSAWSPVLSVKAPGGTTRTSTSTTTRTSSGGRYVSVTPWPTKHSTLWGIAETYYGDGTKWTRIWNHSINTDLRRRRGKPRLIRAGDRFWVPN